MAIHVGTAGWSIPRAVADRFPTDGTGLERYAAHFDCAEINSSFHRPHRSSTWERWRDSVPDHFRFSVKLPKTITHERKLVDYAEPLSAFIAEAQLLGDKLAVLLVQLPPKLAFDERAAETFFTELAGRSPARIACEPRNLSWFTDEADALLNTWQVARVAADPAICDTAARPGGDCALAYWRLHGSPQIYRSSYADRIDSYAEQLVESGRSADETWCIFDNTASSAGGVDALALTDRLRA